MLESGRPPGSSNPLNENTSVPPVTTTTTQVSELAGRMNSGTIRFNETEPSPKSERTRQRILDAAARTFRNKGFTGTTLNDIAEAAALRAGSIYYHFDSKERLLEEVLDIGIARVAAAVREVIEALPPETSPTERIRHGIGVHIRSLLYHGEYTSAAFRIFWQAPPDSRARVLSRRRDYADYWRELLHAARAAGEIDPARDLSLVRMFLFGALNWSVEWYDPEKGPIDAFAREAAETFLHGILVPESSEVPVE